MTPALNIEKMRHQLDRTGHRPPLWRVIVDEMPQWWNTHTPEQQEMLKRMYQA